MFDFSLLKPSAFLKRRSNLLLRLFVAFIIVWLSLGYFPVVNYEGDSAQLAAGCERMYANSFSIPPDYYYMWDMQPLVGIVIVSIKYILPALTCEFIYNILTIVFSIAYMFLASCFLSRLSGIRWEHCFFVLLLFPESYSISYYSNTAIFASFTSLLGFLLLLKKPLNLPSVMLLGIAPLFRVDVLTIYPFLFFLFWHLHGFRKSITYTIIYLLATVLISILGFGLLNANPLNTLNTYSSIADDNSHRFDFDRFAVINASYYSISGLLLIFFGVYKLIISRLFLLVLSCIVPIALLYVLYRDFSGAAPKHIQYLLPYLSLLAVIGLHYLMSSINRKKQICLVILAILIALQAFLGFRFFPISKPWISREYSTMYPRPTLSVLCSSNVSNLGRIDIALGTGQVLPTADEVMIHSGYIFTPLYWRSIRNSIISERALFLSLVECSSDSLVVAVTQSTSTSVSQMLHSVGFHRTIPDTLQPRNIVYNRADKSIRVMYLSVDRFPESFNAAFESIANRPFYLLVRYDWELYIINENLTNAEPISSQLSIVR